MEKAGRFMIPRRCVVKTRYKNGDKAGKKTMFGKEVV